MVKWSGGQVLGSSPRPSPRGGEGEGSEGGEGRQRDSGLAILCEGCGRGSRLIESPGVYTPLNQNDGFEGYLSTFDFVWSEPGMHDRESFGLVAVLRKTGAAAARGT